MPYLLRPEPDPMPMDCRILTAALELFVNKGYHNVSVHDVQKHAKVSIGSIYNHFGGKQGIARALYDRLLQEMNQMVDSVISQKLSIIEKCNSIIKLWFEYTESHSDIIAFMLHAKHNEFITDQPPICSAEPFRKIRELVQDGIDNGEIRACDCLIAASVIFGGAYRMISLRLDGLVDRPLPEYYDQLIDATWQSIRTSVECSTPRLASNS
ncbi:MAG: TetR/AcrR family transcriptional regulator [Gammaproteobacteria bacterium]|nr:TetR/AcrR family transcriptional regulator [Gammaproteobacteria bacterium]